MYQYTSINYPQLPPLSGYVEDEDETGKRVYRKIETSQDQQIVQLQQENTKLSAQIKATSESNAFLEECIVEIAGIVYA